MRIVVARALLGVIVCLALMLLALESAEAQLALTGMGGGARPVTGAAAGSSLRAMAALGAAGAAGAALWVTVARRRRPK